MLKRRDFLKGIVLAGTGFGSSVASASSDAAYLKNLTGIDTISAANTRNKCEYTDLMGGCSLDTLARVIKTDRAKITGWMIYEDHHDWLEIQAYCFGLNFFQRLFPLHVMFLGNDLIKAQGTEMQEKIAKAKGQAARDLIEEIKDKVLEDLKRDSIIAFSGRVYTEEPVYFLMNPRYTILPADFSEGKGKALFTDSEGIHNLRKQISNFTWSENFMPFC